MLVVDGDEGFLLDVFRALLRDNDQCDVLVARSMDTARCLVRELPFDVVLLDVGAPGQSGLGFLRWLSVEWPETVRIGIVSGASLGAHDELFDLGCVRVLEKPISGEAVRSVVLSVLDAEGSLTGRLSRLSVADVVQMLCSNGMSTQLCVRNKGTSGVVVIENGEVVHAAWGAKTGEEAVFEIIAAEGGSFKTRPLPDEFPRSVSTTWQFLILEGLRLLDESSTGGLPAIAEEDEDQSASAAGRAPGVPRPERAVHQLVEEGFRMLKAGDRDGAARCWREALELDPDNKSLRVNIKRLETSSRK